ncbi:MAG: hypothetical protein JOS17DRAFT_841638 [Linnemannia elongata]|nr:MAG: hypothetical protein JOS17DRAFT_841638 [Linnemannia elongata]
MLSPTPEPHSPSLLPLPDHAEVIDPPGSYWFEPIPDPTISLPDAYRLILHIRHISHSNWILARTDDSPVPEWTHNPNTQSHEDFNNAIQDRLDWLLQGHYMWPQPTYPYVRPAHTPFESEMYLEMNEDDYQKHLETAWWKVRNIVGHDDVVLHIHVAVLESLEDPADLQAPLALGNPVGIAALEVPVTPSTQDVLVGPIEQLSLLEHHSNTDVEVDHQATQDQNMGAEGMSNPQRPLLDNAVQGPSSTLPLATGHLFPGEDDVEEISSPLATRVLMETPVMSLGADEFFTQEQSVVHETDGLA